MTTVQRRVIQAGVLALIALACVAEVTITIHSDSIVWHLTGPFERPWYSPLVDILPGFAFILAGLIELKPRNRVGLLMMGVGVGLLIGSSPLDRTLADVIPAPIVFIAVVIAGSVWPVMLLHLLLAFPGGVLVSRLDRVVVRVSYVVFPLVTVIAVALFVAHPLLGMTSTVPQVVAVAAGVIEVAFLLIGSGLVVRRWLMGGRARRRSMSPLLLAMVPLVVFLLFYFGGIVRYQIWHIPAGQSWEVLISIAPLALVAVPVGVGIGLLRSGLDMSSVGDLVVKLSGGLAPEQLQPALALALHDPSLEVAYWLPAQGWFSDLEGSRMELPTPDSERAASMLGDPEGPVAALVYDSSLVHEGQLVDTAAAAVRMALENARLQVQLRAQLEEVRESRARLVEAADSERQRVERNLHDGAQQQLVTLLLSMQATKTEAIRRSDRATAALIDANIAELKQALGELRELAHGIHPTILTQAGLVPAIRSLTERCPIPVDVRGDLGEDRLAPPLEATLYFVVSEAITNAVKHSKARQMCVSLGRSSDVAAVDISDDGGGGADLSGGSGLRGLSDRVAAVGGRLVIKSDKKSGTIIHAEVPCA